MLLHGEKVRRGRSSKLSASYIGPYEIISVDGVNITLQLPRNKTLKVQANRLKPFFGRIAGMNRKLWFACVLLVTYSVLFGCHCAAI